jgi:hypothetical protein
MLAVAIANANPHKDVKKRLQVVLLKMRWGFALEKVTREKWCGSCAMGRRGSRFGPTLLVDMEGNVKIDQNPLDGSNTSTATHQVAFAYALM